MKFSFRLAKDFLNVRSLFGFPQVLEKYRGVPISYLMAYGFGTSWNDHVLIPDHALVI